MSFWKRPVKIQFKFRVVPIRIFPFKKLKKTSPTGECDSRMVASPVRRAGLAATPHARAAPFPTDPAGSPLPGTRPHAAPGPWTRGRRGSAGTRATGCGRETRARNRRLRQASPGGAPGRTGTRREGGPLRPPGGPGRRGRGPPGGGAGAAGRRLPPTPGACLPHPGPRPPRSARRRPPGRGGLPAPGGRNSCPNAPSPQARRPRAPAASTGPFRSLPLDTSSMELVFYGHDIFINQKGLPLLFLLTF